MNARKLLSAAKAVEAAYIEDVFSTFLYTGNGSTQTITNEIDLAGKGGLVWIKRRDLTIAHGLWDTARGAGTGTSNATNKALASNLTDAQGLGSTYPGEDLDYVNAFNANGFSLTTAAGGRNLANGSGGTYASWTFRKQAKFFDVVTYTGNGNVNQTISHNLGATPGVVIVKSTGSGAWGVWHRSLGTQNLELNSTGTTLGGYSGLITSVTSSSFQVGRNDTDATYSYNQSSTTYVAYLFAHDAGGFGASGSDNVITCGSYTGNGSATGPTVTLGYEPQWLLVKNATTGATSWTLVDNMRGLTVGGVDPVLQPNAADAELSSSSYNWFSPTATGFQVTTSDAWVNTSTNTYIYIAIRRGPMKTPTTGTSVYNAIARTGTGAATTVTGAGFAPDLVIPKRRSIGNSTLVTDRLRGATEELYADLNNAAQTAPANAITGLTMDGFAVGGNAGTVNQSPETYINWFFRRAPGFFDVVCYTGTGVNNRDISHNLGVSPELVIVKSRSLTQGWIVANSLTGYGNYMQLQSTNASAGASYIQSVTATTFRVDDTAPVNSNSNTYVAYLFATCPGVSKVGTYTGTGNTLQIDCGFTGGARFVLIKRTDSAGDWYVWDSARGIVAGNDPYLLLNSTAAEVTTTDWVDTHSPGFELSSAVGNNANINTATYIFLAIA